MKKRLEPRLKVRTSVSLSKTKPIKASRFSNLKKKITASRSKIENKPAEKAPLRQQPESRLAQEHRLNLWFIPAQIAFFLNGLYYLAFFAMGFIAVLSDYKWIQPVFTLPFDTNFSSFFLLETASLFALMASLLFFHAARTPKQYRWFYFTLLLVFMPYHFLSNLQKIQIELPQNFQNYLYFDTIASAVFLGALLLSLYPYLKSFTRKP